MADTFSVARELSRREIEAHQKRFIALTASAPVFKDFNGKMEYVVDLRVGIRENQGLIRDAVVSSGVVGAVTDMNLPVLCERSEAGQITVIGRSQVRLPDVSAIWYTYHELGFDFANRCTQDEDTAGEWRDAFGHVVEDPTLAIGPSILYEWSQGWTELGAKDLGTFDLGESHAAWQETARSKAT